MNKNNNQKRNILIAGVVVVAIAALTFISKNGDTPSLANDAETASVTSGGDLVINKADISEEAKFYGYDSNGTYMELLAVRASDGTVRTALNTCQVCNNSGRGYYVQEGDAFVCQNCGNRFATDEIELTKNGCNPVPLEPSFKSEDDEKIVISSAAFEAYESLFEVWKK